MNVVPDGTIRADSARIRTCIAVALACVAAGAFLFAAHLHGDASETGDPSASAHVRIERDGLVYSFDAIANRERLTEVGNPDVDLLRDRPADALRLRRAIEADIGRPLESLVDANRETIEALKRMGYL